MKYDKNLVKRFGQYGTNHAKAYMVLTMLSPYDYYFKLTKDDVGISIKYILYRSRIETVLYLTVIDQKSNLA